MIKERCSGILMPIFSLPTKYGIGTFGKEAYDFVDFLKEAKQKYWQLLPLGPLSYGDSPYQSFSTFAGNPYFVDLDMLVEDKLLTKKDIEDIVWCDTKDTVNYGTIYNNRFTVLKKAYDKGIERDKKEFDAFVEKKKGWIKNYALYMACKKHFGMKAWYEWPMDIRLHTEKAVKEYTEKLQEDIEFYEYIQFLFYKQWNELKTYANKKGIQFIGDLPIYVALDSADVWSEPKWFYLDEENKPIEVAGCPPDAFSKTGQLWGNPLYRYDRMKEDGFGWWIRRVDGAFDLYDVLRIDHFRGMASYWAVPYGDKTAEGGKWKNGPGMDLVGVLTGWFHDKEFIAEDLGEITPDVIELLKDSKLPGMRVLQFAFGGDASNINLPHAYDKNSICYVGTHDNMTLQGWLKTATKAEMKYAKQYLGINKEEGYHEGFIRAGMSSVSNVFICQMQDYLKLGNEGRINEPGTTSGNWVWRMEKGMITKKLAKEIADLTVAFGRAKPEPKKEPKEAKKEVKKEEKE